MSHKRNEALRHVQHSMHHVIAAGEGSDRAPDSCKLCPYYRPDFKFRTCLYAHCPYKKQVNVFRSTPEKWDILYGIAFRYLVKPLDESLFTAAMDAVVQELHSKHFTVEYEGATLSLETVEIYYLESHGHKVLIHCKDQDLTLRMTIPEALEQLPKRCFASPHKSYLVNMEHIVYATGTAVVLSSGNQLPISRRKRQEFNQNFNAYLGR